jgi:hypothetical protein
LKSTPRIAIPLDLVTAGRSAPAAAAAAAEPASAAAEPRLGWPRGFGICSGGGCGEDGDGSNGEAVRVTARRRGGPAAPTLGLRRLLLRLTGGVHVQWVLVVGRELAGTLLLLLLPTGCCVFYSVLLSLTFDSFVGFRFERVIIII